MSVACVSQPLTRNDRVRLFKDLSNQIRFDIVALLMRADGMRPTDIAMKMGAPYANISYHLGDMVKSGILTKEEYGRESFYSISPKRVDAVIAAMAI